MKPIRIQFAHGLEGSPQGNKARLFAQHFEAHTPAMDTSDFWACVELHARELGRFQPDILVGSSFGGAVGVALLQSGRWRGRTLLLAQAAAAFGFPIELPDEPEIGPIWLVHGTRDAVVDPGDSRRLAASGPPDRVRLIEVDDDHPLSESSASGALVAWIHQLMQTG